VAVPVVAVGPVEGGEVELVCDVKDEPGEVAFGEPVAQVGWEQEGMVAVAAQEIVSHKLFYYFATFAPNALLLKLIVMEGLLSSGADHVRQAALLMQAGLRGRGLLPC